MISSKCRHEPAFRMRCCEEPGERSITMGTQHWHRSGSLGLLQASVGQSRQKREQKESRVVGARWHWADVQCSISKQSTSSAFSCCLNSRSFQASLHIEMPSFIKECQHICMTCFYLPILVYFSQSLYVSSQMPAVGPESIFFAELCSLPPASCGQWGSLPASAYSCRIHRHAT